MSDLSSAGIPAAVERLLETMCFSTVIGPANRETAQAALAIATRVEFHGPQNGAVWVGLSDAGVHLLASGFLGSDQVNQEQAREFAAEVANIVCGAIVSKLPPGGQYLLSTPQAVDPAELAEPHDIRSDFELEDGVMTIAANAS